MSWVIDESLLVEVKLGNAGKYKDQIDYSSIHFESKLWFISSIADHLYKETKAAEGDEEGVVDRRLTKKRSNGSL